eukprot:scaffold110792_cov45-Phaeocystis_antarctica.AAC.1
MEARPARNRTFARTQPFLYRRMTDSCVVPRATNCGSEKTETMLQNVVFAGYSPSASRLGRPPKLRCNGP